MYLLVQTRRPITDICLDVGFASLGTFSRTFAEIVGDSPSVFRGRATPVPVAVPNCFAMAWLRPHSFGEAPGRRPPVASDADSASRVEP